MPKKGIRLLLQAFAANRHIGKEWMVAIARPNEGGELGVLKNLASDLEIEDAVRFVGAVTETAKLKALALADAFALRSHSEGMPVAALEAAALGLPLLISTECTFHAFSTQGGALMGTPGLTDASKALRLLLSMSHGELLHQGAAASELAEKKFFWPSLTNQWIKICSTVK